MTCLAHTNGTDSRRATDNAALTLREVRSREASVTSGVSGGAALVLNLQQHAQIADAAASSAAVQGGRILLPRIGSLDDKLSFDFVVHLRAHARAQKKVWP
jgi:hypothetical protein